MQKAKEIFVDRIDIVEGTTFGLCQDLRTSNENLKIIYGQDLGEIFKLETLKNGVFRQFDKFHQYIFSAETELIPRYNIKLLFIDVDNNVNSALDIFTTKDSGLSLFERTRIMDLYNEIQKSNLIEKAKMKVREL